MVKNSKTNNNNKTKEHKHESLFLNCCHKETKVIKIRILEWDGQTKIHLLVVQPAYFLGMGKK